MSGSLKSFEDIVRLTGEELRSEFENFEGSQYIADRLSRIFLAYVYRDAEELIEIDAKQLKDSFNLDQINHVLNLMDSFEPEEVVRSDVSVASVDLSTNLRVISHIMDKTNLPYAFSGDSAIQIYMENNESLKEIADHLSNHIVALMVNDEEYSLEDVKLSLEGAVDDTDGYQIEFVEHNEEGIVSLLFYIIDENSTNSRSDIPCQLFVNSDFYRYSQIEVMDGFDIVDLDTAVRDAHESGFQYEQELEEGRQMVRPEELVPIENKLTALERFLDTYE